MKVEYLVGVDIGHGESAASCVRIGSNKITRLKLKGDLITQDDAETEAIYSAYYIKTNETGADEVVLVAGGDAAGIASQYDSLRMGFKKRVSEMNDFDFDSMRTFVRTLYGNMLRYNPFLVDSDGVRNFRLYVACPTEWTVDQAVEYLNLINLAGMPADWITSEAIAASMKHRSLVSSSSKRVLVIDYGSSTIDYSAFITGSDGFVLSSSRDRGAYHVEDALFYAVEQDVEKIAEQYDAVANTLGILLEARRAKEIFYRALLNVYDERLKIKIGAQNFDYTANHESFVGIERNWSNSELAEVDGIRDYRTEVLELFSEIYDELNHRGFTPDYVFLSGSASQMDFVEDFIGNVFPDAEIWKDAMPQYVVSDGIVELAKIYNADPEQAASKITAQYNVYQSVKELLEERGLDSGLEMLEQISSEQIDIVRGLCCYLGVGYNKSGIRAFELLKHSDSFSQAMQAIMFFRGFGVKKNDEMVCSILKLLPDCSVKQLLERAVEGEAAHHEYTQIYDDRFIVDLCQVDVVDKEQLTDLVNYLLSEC